MSLQALTLRHGDDERRAYFASAADVELQAPGTSPAAFLAATELALFSAMKFVPKQQSFLLGRLAAKRALGALIAEADLRRIEIRPGIFGQPLVHHPRAGNAEVTLSHSHGLAAALAYPGEFPLGMDLETVSADAARTVLGELGMSEAEKIWLATEAVGETTACGVLWTAREALGKSMKIGLNCPPGILALSRIEPTSAMEWTSLYANFPQSRCLSRTTDDCVLSIAMPAKVELSRLPGL